MNFGDLTPYLTYDYSRGQSRGQSRGEEVFYCHVFWLLPISIFTVGPRAFGTILPHLNEKQSYLSLIQPKSPLTLNRLSKIKKQLTKDFKRRLAFPLRQRRLGSSQHFSSGTVLHSSLGSSQHFSLATLKGLCHEMNIFLKTYNNKKVLSVHALMVFTIFLFLC